MQMNSRHLAAIGTMVLAMSSVAGAQQRVNVPAARPGSISGVVVDTLGRILDVADVVLTPSRRRVTAGSDGTFRFDSLKPGKYTVTARRVGYYPVSAAVTLGDSGKAIALGMAPISRTLPPVITSAARGGISGVIARTGAGSDTSNVLAGAKIQVAGSSRRAVSDSTGSFYISVPPGRHMVSIKREGYGSKMVSVNVPPDSGRRILVWMAPGNDPGANREANALDALNQRLMRRSAAWSTLMSREEIQKLDMPEAIQVAQSGAGLPMLDTCSAIIDGGPLRLPLWTLKAADIEMMEVYLAKGARQSFTNSRNPSPRPQAQRRQECATVYIWLRK
jgi:hypothetical protein